MAKIVITWELGAGLGHLVRLKPLAEGLLQRGHKVWAIVKDLHSFEHLFGQTQVRRLQAPAEARPRNPLQSVITFSQILHNVGLGDQAELRSRLCAWRNIFELIDPDLILCEHSPKALLASRGWPARRTIIGTGFSCPAVSSPMPNFWPKQPAPVEKLLEHEKRLTETANELLAEWGGPPLNALGDLYREIDAQFLATFAELDPYRDRPATTYWGCWPYLAGDRAEWPNGSGPKVLAYLKPFSGLEALLSALVARRFPTLVVGSGFSLQLRRKFQSPTLRIVGRPVDMKQACSACDIVILNATHGSTAAALLAGKPTLLLPLVLEQALTAARVVDLGAAQAARIDRSTEMEQALDRIAQSEEYKSSALKFAARYAGFNPETQIEHIVEQLHALAAGKK
jgi:hypothetical protein